MADPISGAGGGAAKLAMQEMLKQQQGAQVQNPAQSGQASSFASKMDGPQKAQQAQQVSEVQKTHEVTKPRSIRDMANVNKTQRVDPSQKAQSTELNKANGDKGTGGGGGGISRVFNGINKRKGELDTMIGKVMKGKSFSNQELLALQYKVSTYSMEMDLVSKVVEKATSGIKQAMNTQV